MEGLVLRPAKGYRVVLLGSVAVGKTALATQFACGRFPEHCEPSVEEGSRAVPLVLVGTKADLDAERQVLTAQGRALAREWRCPFLEVTAKSKMMVDRVFTQVVREMEALAPPAQEAPRIPNALEMWPAERFIG
ncbi:Ras-related protein Rap-2a [Lemmus lemmus]